MRGDPDRDEGRELALLLVVNDLREIFGDSAAKKRKLFTNQPHPFFLLTKVREAQLVVFHFVFGQVVPLAVSQDLAESAGSPKRKLSLSLQVLEQFSPAFFPRVVRHLLRHLDSVHVHLAKFLGDFSNHIIESHFTMLDLFLHSIIQSHFKVKELKNRSCVTSPPLSMRNSAIARRAPSQPSPKNRGKHSHTALFSTFEFRE